MDFSKEINKGKLLGEKMERLRKKDKLVTFWISGEIRDKAYKKCPNLSEFLRMCVQRVADSPIDKQINKLYKNIIDDVEADLEKEGVPPSTP